MRPRQIQVFDGLRMTTEHINHLQGAFTTSLQDLRAILGLRKVYWGFEVMAQGENTVTVQPGLAFDLQKNRIASDEPKTVEVQFEPEENTRYVCIQYDQAETGETEGQKTLIWDSCTVLLRPDPPQAGENLIPIAQLARGAGGALEITDLVRPKVPAPNTGEGEGASREPGPDGGSAPSGESPAEGGPPSPGEEAAPETQPVVPVEEGESDAPAVMPANGGPENGGGTPVTMVPSASTGQPNDSPAGNGTAPASNPTPANGAPAMPQPQPAGSPAAPAEGEGGRQVRQGVSRFTPPPGAENYLQALSSVMRQKLVEAGPADQAEVSASLAETNVELGFQPASLTCYTLISAAFWLKEGSDVPISAAPPTPSSSIGSPGEGGVSPASSPQFSAGRVQSTSQGEITFTADNAAAFGLSTTHGGSYMPVELLEGGVARLPLAAWMAPGQAENQPGMDIFRGLQLLVQVAQKSQGFGIIYNLVWEGGLREDLIQQLESNPYGFAWEASLAWKAWGMSVHLS